MKLHWIILGAIFVCIFTIVMVALNAPQWLGRELNWGLVTFIFAGLIIVAFFLEYEARNITTKEVALISIMGALAAIVRIPFAPVPNAQPATFIIICTGYVFGPIAGFMTGAVTAIVSNLFLGHGPWTLFQIIGWGLGGAFAGLLGIKKVNVWVLGAFGLLWGFVFGVIMNLWFWASLIYPLTWQTFVISQLNSVWFDAVHALTNALLITILGRKVICLLQNWHDRFFWKKGQL